MAFSMFGAVTHVIQATLNALTKVFIFIATAIEKVVMRGLNVSCYSVCLVP